MPTLVPCGKKQEFKPLKGKYVSGMIGREEVRAPRTKVSAESRLGGLPGPPSLARMPPFKRRLLCLLHEFVVYAAARAATDLGWETRKSRICEKRWRCSCEREREREKERERGRDERESEPLAFFSCFSRQPPPPQRWVSGFFAGARWLARRQKGTKIL